MAKQSKTKEQLLKEIESLKKKLTRLKPNSTAKDLREISAEEFRKFLNHAPLPYQSLDINGKILSVNNAWLESLGYSLDEVLGRWFGDFLSESNKELFKSRFPIFVATGGVKGVEFEMLRKNGAIVSVIFDGKIEYNQAGQFEKTHCIFKDVTGHKISEKSFKGSEEFIRHILNSLDDIVYVKDADLRIIAVYGSKVEKYGFTPEILLGKTPRDIFSHEDATIHEKADKAALAGKSLKYEWKTSILGGEVQFQISISPLRDNEGRISGVVGIARDITQRVIMEETIRKSEERYRAISELTSDSAFSINVGDDGIISTEWLAGSPADSIFGPLAGQADHINWIDSVYSEDKEILIARFGKVMKGQTDVTDFRIVARNGEIKWLRSYGKPVWDQNEKRVIRIMVALQDISIQKNAEKALMESELKYRELVEKAGIGIVIDDINGQFLYFNETFNEIFGYSREEMEGKSIDFLVHNNDKEKERQKHYRRLQSAEPISHYSFRGQKKDGTELYLEIDFTWLKEGGKIVGARSYVKNITQRKRAEEAIRYREKFERLVTNISTDFINMEVSQIDERIEAGLKAIGEFADVDRSYLFQFADEENTIVRNTHEWCAPGIKPEIENLQNLHVSDIPWWMEKMNRLEEIYVPKVSELPKEAELEKKIFEEEDIRSLVGVPLVHGKTLVGFLGFDSVRREREWHKEIISLLHIAGVVFVSGLMRRQAEKELRESELKYRTIYEQAGDAIITVIPPEGIIINVNEAAVLITGYSKEELCAMLTYDLLIPESREEIIEEYGRQILLKGSFELETKLRIKSGETIDAALTGKLIELQGKTYLQIMGKDITERKRAEAERERLILELQKAISDVKMLRGLLPICANCKKIRDDSGYWNQVEDYLRARSDLEFSHSLCPECAKILYPEIYK